MKFDAANIFYFKDIGKLFSKALLSKRGSFCYTVLLIEGTTICS